MKKYILRMEEEPCNYEDGMKYYKCVDAPYWQLSERTLAKLTEFQKGLQAEYQRGLNDAWECVMKIAADSEKLFNIFGTYSYHKVFEKYTPQEATAKIAEYEQKNAINIGDEVKFNHDNIRATVMDQSDKEDRWWLYTENGCIEEWQDAYFRKTGRTFPQIEEVLKAMRDGT